MSKIDLRLVQGIIARKGIHLCVGIPATLLGFGLILRYKFEFLAAPITSDDRLRLIGYALIVVALGGLIVGYLGKRRKLASPELRQEIVSRPGEFGEIIADVMMPIFLLAAAPAGYGLIFYFLGGDLDTYVLLSVCCPAGLMLLRPKEDELERLDREIFGDGEQC